MILSELRDYLRKRGQASLQELALHFDSDPQALRGMLQRWIAKGQVVRRQAGASCGDGCRQCDPASVEIYVWSQNTGSVSEHPLIKNLGCSR